MQNYDTFISYETKTGKSYAEHLKDALEKCGYFSFLADLSIDKGKEWKKEINSALESCKYFIVVITSLTLKSGEVIEEYEKAVRLEKRIIPCRWKKIKVSETKELSKLQQIEFKNECELANEVVFELNKIANREKEIAIDRDVKEFLSRGNLFWDLGEFEKAAKEYRKAIEINPGDADAHFCFGFSLQEFEQYKEAEKEFRKTIEIDPGDADAHGKLGLLLLLYLDKPDEGIKEIKIARNLYKKKGDNKYERMAEEYLKNLEKKK